VRWADLRDEFMGQPRFFWLGHKSQRVGDAFVGKKIQEGRLLELCGKALTKRPIEHRLACGVGEVGEDHAVLVGKFCRSANRARSKSR